MKTTKPIRARIVTDPQEIQLLTLARQIGPDDVAAMIRELRAYIEDVRGYKAAIARSLSLVQVEEGTVQA